MRIYSVVAPIVFVCAFLCAPVRLLAQSVTLGGSPNVAAAEDFATRSFQDPWDMNELTDFGWFLYGADAPSPNLSNISFSNGVFSATTGNGSNLFLLETGNPFAASLGKTGTTFPIDANTYRMVAIRMNINGSPQARLAWNRDNLWDGTATLSNIFNVSSGWRTYLIDIPTLGVWSGPIAWNGSIRSLEFYPSGLSQLNLQIDWIRLVNINSALCRQVTWSGLTNGQFDLYLSGPNGSTTAETLLAENVTNNTASHGCSGTGSGYNFYAGALAPGSYRVIARRDSDGMFFPSPTAYVVNAAPTLTVTSPSEEGSTDDFATQLGNPWNMDSLADVERFDHVTGQSITTISTVSPGGAALGNTQVLHATSTAAQSGGVGDPQVALLWEGGPNNGARIDPNRYRILTVEFGMPNIARSVNTGSIARIIWRVAGSTNECVSDDIIFSSRAGVNVLDKLSLDMADRTVLPLESGGGLSQLGWVPGSSGTPGIDRFRLDPHEFSNPSPFFIRRVKLAALEGVNSGFNYTISWGASEGGAVTIYRDTDRNPFNGGQTQIGTTTASAGAGSFVWTVNAPAGEYFIYVVINDGAGNSNAAYSRWPIVIGTGGPPPPSAPPNPRILQ